MEQRVRGRKVEEEEREAAGIANYAVAAKERAGAI